MTCVIFPFRWWKGNKSFVEQWETNNMGSLCENCAGLNEMRFTNLS